MSEHVSPSSVCGSCGSGDHRNHKPSLGGICIGCSCSHTPDAPDERVRELTVEQLIERLSELPPHHYVSPMVDGVLGAGIDVWQMFDPQTTESIVVFGEPKRELSPIVPPDWSRTSPIRGVDS